ncbi:hypothetical protein [Georgenia sp. SYP-B2076]|uniref:hypothetical protein n=1 Tax=Georgenia sp. SYP-B2076 TaxID=2495881 RepID=UPI000F8C5F0B|nr:hypothetical protein [Georgenia sp. SYP-B2076]
MSGKPISTNRMPLVSTPRFSSAAVIVMSPMFSRVFTAIDRPAPLAGQERGDRVGAGDVQVPAHQGRDHGRTPGRGVDLKVEAVLLEDPELPAVGEERRGDAGGLPDVDGDGPGAGPGPRLVARRRR